MSKKQTNSGSAMCGGVVSETTFYSDVWAYLMCYTLPDDIYEKWSKEKDEKKRHAIFEKHAVSHI